MDIVESIDIGAPVRVVYDEWTQFADFSGLMHQVETVEQVPGRIIWRSAGGKVRVDGAVTFHELAPDLTRVMLVLVFHPQSLVGRVGTIWRAPGRRARLRLKHFARHVMTETMLHLGEMAADGRRGQIRDGQVAEDHQTAHREERAEERPARPVRAEEPPSRPVRRKPAARPA
ncbi:hypothetical protein ACTMTI_28375 [Nonomuraea sp. H19]|uniref:hypothetical protein n=1 Tax=Nonomuraea sp. H19 TaxID=3452206 RepID=UPI003F8C21F0